MRTYTQTYAKNVFKFMRKEKKTTLKSINLWFFYIYVRAVYAYTLVCHIRKFIQIHIFFLSCPRIANIIKWILDKFSTTLFIRIMYLKKLVLSMRFWIDMVFLVCMVRAEYIVFEYKSWSLPCDRRHAKELSFLFGKIYVNNNLYQLLSRKMYIYIFY